MSDIFDIRSKRNNNIFDITKSSMRQNFNEFVKRRPNWMIYVRRDNRYPCGNCYDPTTRSPETGCQECFGLGYKIQFEKHATRRFLPAKEVQSPLEPIGYLSKFKAIIHVPRYYYPTSKDLYLEVEWDVDISSIENYGKPINIINAYQVDEVVAQRQDEVTFISCGCDTYNFMLGDMNNWLKQLGEVWVSKKVI